MLKLTCPGGLTGMPQITLPLAKLEGCPLGISIAGLPGSDWMLLDLAEKLAAA